MSLDISIGAPGAKDATEGFTGSKHERFSFEFEAEKYIKDMRASLGLPEVEIVHHLLPVGAEPVPTSRPLGATVSWQLFEIVQALC